MRTTCDHCGDQAVIRETRFGALCDMHHKRLQRTGTVARDVLPEFPPPPGAWVEQAACRGLPTDWWFSERGRHDVYSAGQAVCDDCPVRQDCGDYALDHGIKHGVWGGMSEKQRRLTRRENRGAA
jgi:WhiB family redox-sensing transcriptional regulator